MTHVYVVQQEWGTCPSDAMESPHVVFASKADADAYVASRPAPAKHSGGPYYTAHEIRFFVAGEAVPQEVDE